MTTTTTERQRGKPHTPDLHRINTTSTQLTKLGASSLIHSTDFPESLPRFARYRDDGHAPSGGASDGSDGRTRELLGGPAHHGSPAITPRRRAAPSQWRDVTKTPAPLLQFSPRVCSWEGCFPVAAIYFLLGQNISHIKVYCWDRFPGRPQGLTHPPGVLSFQIPELEGACASRAWLQNLN